MDSLGVRDPQAAFLRGRINVRIVIRLAPEERTDPKCPVPACYGPVFFQNALLDDTECFFVLPPPIMTCSKICKTMSLTPWGH